MWFIRSVLGNQKYKTSYNIDFTQIVEYFRIIQYASFTCFKHVSPVLRNCTCFFLKEGASYTVQCQVKPVSETVI